MYQIFDGVSDHPGHARPERGGGRPGARQTATSTRSAKWSWSRS